MTAFILQDDLIEEIKVLFKDMKLKTPEIDDNGKEKLTNPNVYSQSLPMRIDDEQDEPFPYIIVRLDSGEGSELSSHLVKTRIIIGIYDDDINTNGHKDVMNIIQKLNERFARTPVLNNNYVMKNDREFPFAWALQDDETYPYYFGVAEMTWETRAIRRENKYT